MTQSSILTQVPENTNFLQPNRFTFTFPTLPFLRYFGQTLKLPGISTSPVKVETPFSATWRHGDKLVFEDLAISVIIDEDLRVWEETYRWLRALTFPHEFPEYVTYTDRQATAYHDGILTLNNNANVPNIRVIFRNCHPTSLTGINFSTMENANTILTADITFRYDTFQIEHFT